MQGRAAKRAEKAARVARQILVAIHAGLRAIPTDGKSVVPVEERACSLRITDETGLLLLAFLDSKKIQAKIDLYLQIMPA